MDIRNETIYEEVEEDDDEDEESSEEESEDEEDEEDEEVDEDESESEDSDDNGEGTDSSATSSASGTSVVMLDNRPQRCAIIGQQCETFETPGLSLTSVGTPSLMESSDVAEDSESSSATTVVAMPQTSSPATSVSLSTVVEEPREVDVAASSSKSSINTGIYRNLAGCVVNEARGTALGPTTGSSGNNLLLSETKLLPYESRKADVETSSSRSSLSPELYNNLLNFKCKEIESEITASGSGSTLKVVSKETESTDAADSVTSVNVGMYSSLLNAPASDPQRLGAAFLKSKQSIFAGMYKNLRKPAKSETQKVAVEPSKFQSLQSTEIYRNHEMYVDSVKVKEFKKNFKSSESSVVPETSFITNICRALCKSEAPSVTSCQGSELSPTSEGDKEDVKSLGEVMQYLERCESTDDKLRLMCDKYSSMIQTQEKLQLTASESMRQISDLRSEKEALEAKHARAAKVRDRLKLVCQSLQQQIRELREESLGKGEEDKEECRVTAVDKEADLQMECLRKENVELKMKLESTKEEALRQEASIEEMRAESRLRIAINRTAVDKEAVLEMDRLRKENDELKKKLESTKEEAVRQGAAFEEMRVESLLRIAKNRTAVDKESVLQMEKLRKENEELKKKLESTKVEAVRQGESLDEMRAESRLRIVMNREMKMEHDLEIEKLKEEKVTLMTEVLAMVGRYEGAQEEVDKTTRILEEREIELQTIREEEKFLKAEKEKYRVALEKAEKDAESWNLLWKKSHRTLLDTNGKRREQRTELFEAGRKIVVLKALCKKFEEEQRSMKKTIKDLKSQRKESRFNVIEVKQTGDSLSKVNGNDSLCQLVRSYGDMYSNMAAKSEDNVNGALADSFESLMGNLIGNGAMRGQFSRRYLGNSTEEFVVVHVSQVDIEPSRTKPDKYTNNMAFVVNENFDTVGDSSNFVTKKSESDAKSRADILEKFTFCVANDFDIPPRRSVHFNSKVRFKRVLSNTEDFGRLRKTHHKCKSRATTKERRKEEVFFENLKDRRVKSGKDIAARKVVSEAREISVDVKRSKSAKVMIIPSETRSDCLSNSMSPNSSEASTIVAEESPTTSEEYMNDTRDLKRVLSTKSIKDSEDSLLYNPQTNERVEEEMSSFDSLMENNSNSRQDVDTSTSTLDSVPKTEKNNIVEIIDDSETCLSVNYEEGFHELSDVLEVEEDLGNESASAKQEYSFEETTSMPYSVSVLMSKNKQTTSMQQTKNQRTFLVLSTNKRSTPRTPTPAARHYNVHTAARRTSSWATDVENVFRRNAPSSNCSVSSFEETFTEDISGTATPTVQKKPLTLDAELFSDRNEHSLDCFSPTTKSVKENSPSVTSEIRKKLITARPSSRGKGRALSAASARRTGKNSVVLSAKSLPSTAAPSAEEQFNLPIPETDNTSIDMANIQTENWTVSEQESNQSELESLKAAKKHFEFALSKVAENDEKGEFLCHIKYRSKADKAQERQQQQPRVAVDVNLSEEHSQVIDPSPERRDEKYYTDSTNENNREVEILKKPSIAISHWNAVQRAVPSTLQDQWLPANLDLNHVSIQSCPIIQYDRECHQTRTELMSKKRRTKLCDTPADHVVSEIQREKGDCGLVRKCSSLSSTTVHNTTVQNGKSVPTGHVDRVSPEGVGWPRVKSELLEVMKSKEWFMLDRDEQEGESVGEVKSKVAIIGHIRWLPLERFNFTEGASSVAKTGVLADDNKYYLMNKTGLEGQTSWAIGQTDWYRGVTALDTARMQDDAATMRELCSFNNVVTVNTAVYRNEVVALPGAQEVSEVDTSTTDDDSLMQDVCKEAVDEVEAIQVAVDEYPDYDSHVKLALDEEVAFLKKDKPRRNKLSLLMHKLF